MVSALRPEHSYRIFRGVLAFVVITLGFGTMASSSPLASVAADQPMSVYIGPATTVSITDPNSRAFLPDNPYNTLGQSPNLTAYLANNGTTRSYTGNAADGLDLANALALSPGNAFDNCGAWIDSVYTDGAMIRAWYHAESMPNAADCTNASTHYRSVGYAESTDNGRTFVKPNYPNNEVIVAPDPTNTDVNLASVGDQRVIRVGNYFYMYFISYAPCCQVQLARSLVSDGGRPGTWFKYCHKADNLQCPGTDWDQPGQGGYSSAIAPGILSRSWVSYDTSIDEYIGISYHGATGEDGYGLAVSPNGI